MNRKLIKKILHEGLNIPKKEYYEKYFQYDTEVNPKNINPDDYWYKCVYDTKNNIVFYKDSVGESKRWDYDRNDNQIHFQNSNGYWSKREYDNDNNLIYKIDSNGEWEKLRYDNTGSVIYRENSNGEYEDFREAINEGLNIPKITNPEQWFQNLLNLMDEKPDPNLPNKTYYTIRGETYMVYYSNNGNLWYDYNKIYLVFEQKYGLNYQQIKELVKDMVEQHFNLRGITPTLKQKPFLLR